MVTNVADIVTTNCSSTWMSQIESSDPAVVRQLLQQKLLEVPSDAARITGPRGDNDASYNIWEEIKAQCRTDFE